MASNTTEAGSQTLARGLRALALIGESDAPVTVAELAEQLGVHRSMAYRLVRTLEDHGFAERDASGGLTVGIRLVALARGAARDLQSAAAPVLEDLADELGMTTCIVAYDGEAAVTLMSAEPRTTHASVAQRPGSRHSIDDGAPGRVIRSQLDAAAFPPEPFERSRDEVVAGLSSLAVPLPIDRAAALAVVYLTQPVDEAAVAAHLTSAAARILAAAR